MLDNSLKEEAKAFNKRIGEREKAGFIPDLRQLNKCDYFYKSFWRDPHFVNLYVGEMFRNYLREINNHGRGLKILDVGCGGGYFSLELARNGHHVHASDISDKCIHLARETHKKNPFKKGFGSLEYDVKSFDQVVGEEYDVILFSGVLHHLPNVKEAVKHAFSLLKSDGVLISHEPCHERWTKAEASQVVLIRTLLSITGHWYEKELGEGVLKNKSLGNLVSEVLDEYVQERDSHEAHQSPHDNTSSGEFIDGTIRDVFKEVKTYPSFSFLYRLIGGLRGKDEVIHKIADLLYIFDKETVNKGIFEPNYFYIVANKIH